MEVSNTIKSIVASVAAALFAYGLIQGVRQEDRPLKIEPVIRPIKDGDRLRRRRFEDSEKIATGGPLGPDGKTEVVCDLPVSERQHNIASKRLGCCVFRSLDHASRWQNVPQLYQLPEWMVKNGIPGGGYPDKVAKLVPQISAARGLPAPAFVQYEGNDPAILKLALKTGRMVSVTYDGRDVHYKGHIDHMVNLVVYDEQADLACILDNNFVGEDQLVWMSTNEFLDRWKGGQQGWAVVLLAPPPPPPPKN